MPVAHFFSHVIIELLHWCRRTKTYGVTRNEKKIFTCETVPCSNIRLRKKFSRKKTKKQLPTSLPLFTSGLPQYQ